MPVITPKPTVVLAELDSEMMLLDMETEEYYHLNHTARDMWTALSEEDDLESVVSSLAKKYDVDTQTLREDIQDFITDLQAHDFV